ncbi:translation initiation factor IF3-2, chloroplastic isoform X2 [Cryptomeria japonica]|uniref:translation initiation factor IF3-2, chloroplastic isoform X2 n=1 Tax=Cryptomeria japonica TaxID=3369 RepID=UPI0025AC4FFB|nr:translation initiation factor IF3-2, chloroplastic isoform X2 [Cryptomeria japonica]
MSGLAARPFHALFSQRATVKQTAASASLSSAFSGVQLRVGKNTRWSRTQTRDSRGKGGLVVVARAFRGSRRQTDGYSQPSNLIDPALDIDSLESPSVRLIDGEQNMVILSRDEDPPVVRLMDYSKYKFDQQKRKREQQKKSSGVSGDIKELKMGCNIESHDYNVRLRAAQRFLQDGHKVKFMVQFKGREYNYREKAIKIFERFENDLKELGALETTNYADRNMYIVVQPIKGAVKGQAKPNNTKKSEKRSLDKKLMAKDTTEQSPLIKEESVIEEAMTEVSSGV